MGTVGSSFPGDDGTILADIIKPADDGWVGRHAKECKIPEVDVEALWSQFQQLGCNQFGILQKDQITSAESMAIKILKEFPANGEGEVTFQTYCNASAWYGNANTEDRVRAAFCSLNNSKPIDQTMLNEILDEVYKDSSKEVIERLGKVFMEQVDTKQQGFIDENQFVKWVKNMPQDIIQAIMEFKPVPDAKVQPEEKSKDEPRPTVTKSQLQLVAKEACSQDWALFANKLGFTLDEVKEVTNKFPDKTQDQLYDILQQWKQREDKNATMSALQDLIKEAGLKGVLEKL